MNGILTDIFNMYKQEVEIIDSFNKISKEKSKIIRKNDIKVLNSIIRTEEALLMKLATVETRKQKALEIFRNENNIKAKISKRILRKHLSKDELKSFDELSDRFAQSMIDQERYRVENKKIVESRLEYIHNILDVIEKENTKYVAPDVLIDKKDIK